MKKTILGITTAAIAAGAGGGVAQAGYTWDAMQCAGSGISKVMGGTVSTTMGALTMAGGLLTLNGDALKAGKNSFTTGMTDIMTGTAKTVVGTVAAPLGLVGDTGKWAYHNPGKTALILGAATVGYCGATYLAASAAANAQGMSIPLSTATFFAPVTSKAGAAYGWTTTKADEIYNAAWNYFSGTGNTGASNTSAGFTKISMAEQVPAPPGTSNAPWMGMSFLKEPTSAARGTALAHLPGDIAQSPIVSASSVNVNREFLDLDSLGKMTGGGGGSAVRGTQLAHYVGDQGTTAALGISHASDQPWGSWAQAGVSKAFDLFKFGMNKTLDAGKIAASTAANVGLSVGKQMVPMLAVNALLAKKGGGNTQASSTQLDPQAVQLLLQENQRMTVLINQLLQQQGSEQK